MPDFGDSSGQPVDAREMIREIVRAIRRNTVRVIFTTLVCLMVGYGLNLIWPAKFESQTKFRMRDPSMLVGAIQAVAREDLGGLSETKKVEALKTELRSRKRVEEVMNELQWPEWLETAGKESDRRDLVQKFAENLTVEMARDVTGTYMLQVTFQWTSPRKAADFVNKLRDSWIQLTMEGFKQKLEDDNDSQEAVLRQAREELQAAQNNLVAYSRESGADQLMSAEAYHQLMVEYQLAEMNDKAELESKLNEIVRLKDELDAIPPELTLPPGSVPAASFTPGSPEAAAWTKLQETKAAVDELAARYTPSHPKLKLAQRDYEEALKAAQSLGVAGGPPTGAAAGAPPAPEKVKNSAYVAKAEALATAQARRDELESSLKSNAAKQLEARSALERLPSVQVELDRLSSEIELKQNFVAEQEIEMAPLRQRLSRMRGQGFGTDSIGLEGVAGPFDILETGVEPEHPVLPIGAVIMAVALVLGIVLGVSGPILTEVTRSSFGTVKEVSRSLGVPVLGAVDLILTARDLRARTAQRLLTYATMVLVLASLATALYIYRTHEYVLPSALLRTIRDVKMALT
ncbi:MAG TPA: hypothetical protein VFD43_05135 [Planctomycetota bacterium]|nr:hypothetical protein [Planctomycetota bacterium]